MGQTNHNVDSIKGASRMFIQPRSHERQIVLDALHYYDGFQIGATMPASMVDFVRNVGKPFIVEPMAYMFELSPAHVISEKTKKVRGSLASLARRYGSLLADAVGRRVIAAEELLDQGDCLDTLVRNALDYQRSKFDAAERNLFNRYYDKYAVIEKEGHPVPHVASAVTPENVIAPFFLFRSLEDPWYQASLRCAHMAVRHRETGELLFAGIFGSPGLLRDEAAVTRVCRDYSEVQADGYFLWINRLPEEALSQRQLLNLTRLIVGLSRGKYPVIKLYGGYLSVLLNDWGLSGFTCNLSYKTHRDILSYGWSPPGKPKKRFYIPALHRAYPIDEATHLLSIHEFLRCDCRVCHETYRNNMGRFEKEMSRQGMSEKHFLNCRRAEISDASSLGIGGSLKAMQKTLGGLESSNGDGDHIRSWCQSLTALQRTLDMQPALDFASVRSA